MAQFFSPSVADPQALAQQLKATQQFTPATLGPDVLAQQLKLQQDSANAQRLLQDAYTPLQGQMVSGHYVAPSWTQMAAQGLKAYLGQKAANDLPQQYMDIQNTQQQNLARQFGIALGGQTQGASQPQAFPVGASGVPPQGQPMGAQPMPVQPQAAQSSMPLIPGKSAEQSMMLYQQMGPQAYLKLALEQAGPTELQKNAAAMGLQAGTPEYQNYIRAATARPINAGPGAVVLDPVTGKPIFSAPQNGVQTTYGPDGRPQAYEVPGYSDANARIAGQQQDAQESARARYDTQPTLNPQTGNTESKTRLQNVANAEAGAPSVTAINPQVLRSGQNQTLIDTARQLLPQASSGAVSSAFNQGVGVVGVSTKAAQADAQLKIISAQLVAGVPRFEGPQSDKDIQQYREAAGNVADSSIPYQTRLAALKTMEDLQNKYLSSKGQPYQDANMGTVYSPQSQQDFAKLPSGALFKAPDGTLRRKP